MTKMSIGALILITILGTILMFILGWAIQEGINVLRTYDPDTVCTAVGAAILVVGFIIFAVTMKIMR